MIFQNFGYADEYENRVGIHYFAEDTSAAFPEIQLSGIFA